MFLVGLETPNIYKDFEVDLSLTGSFCSKAVEPAGQRKVLKSCLTEGDYFTRGGSTTKQMM